MLSCISQSVVRAIPWRAETALQIPVLWKPRSESETGYERENERRKMSGPSDRVVSWPFLRSASPVCERQEGSRSSEVRWWREVAWSARDQFGRPRGSSSIAPVAFSALATWAVSGQVDANRRRDRPRSSNPREDNYPRREVEPRQLISERVIFRDVLPRRLQWK